ncbi:MAG: hypothetical protein V7739_10920 [Motiliproteus sp.]
MKFSQVVVAMIAVLVAGLCWSAESLIVQSQTAIARDVNLFVGQSSPKKTFKFSRGEAWLDANGSFQLKIEVKHHKLLCAQYRTAIRFGEGDPGCQQVIWDEDSIKLTSKRQCNSAILEHVGGNTIESLAQQYSGLTCAQVEVSCSGRCR